MEQAELFRNEFLVEAAAADYVDLDEKTLRNARARGRRGLVPFVKHRNQVFYKQADLDAWRANNAQRKAGTNPANTLLSRSILPWISIHYSLRIT